MAFIVNHFSKENLNDRAEDQFAQAEEYLRKSDLAGYLFDLLRASKKVIKIKVNLNLYGAGPGREGIVHPQDNCWQPPGLRVGKKAGTVHWCSVCKAARPFASFGSPAIALMHELGHAFQYIVDRGGVWNKLHPTWRKFVSLGLFNMPCLYKSQTTDADSAFTKKIEQSNTEAIELTVANEINKALIFQRGPRYPYLEPIREKYVEGGAVVPKAAPSPEKIKEYISQLRKEGKSPPPVFRMGGEEILEYHRTHCM